MKRIWLELIVLMQLTCKHSFCDVAAYLILVLNDGMPENI